MTRDEALRLLALAVDSDPQAVRQAYEQRRGELELRRNLATPAALAAWVEQAKRLVQAREVLLAATPSSSLSATQLNDLPIAAPKNTAVSAAPALSATQVRDLPLPAPRHQTTAASTPWSGDANRDTLAAPSNCPSIKLAPGTVLANRYEIRRLLGEGGMGIVYAVHDRTRGEEIALKLLQPRLLGDAMARKRFDDEARIASGLSHASIVRVYDLHHDGVHTFLTMELLKGRSLREEIVNRAKACQRFTVEEVRRIGGQLCAALQEAHKQTVHRDVKPENIWLCPDGAVKLMDFGIARLMRPSQFTSTGLALGTAYYMAPEQLKGSKDLDHRADQYALGVVLYELLTGQIPIGAVRPPHQLRKNTPLELSDAVMKALAGEPAERHADMAVFAKALSSHRRTSTKTRWLTVAAALVLLAGAVAILSPWRAALVPGEPAKPGAAVEDKAAAEYARKLIAFEGMLLKGEAALAKKEYEEAGKQFDDVLVARSSFGLLISDPQGSSLRALLVRAYQGAATVRLRLRDADRAVALCTEALALDPHCVAILAMRAEAYCSKRTFDRAIKDCTAAIQLLSQSPQALPPLVAGLYVTRASAHLSKRKYREALADCAASIKAQPMARAYLLQAQSHGALHEPDTALKDCVLAFALEPDSAEGYSTRARANLDKDNYALAAKDALKAVQLDATCAKAYQTLILACRGEEDEDQAKAVAAQAAARLNPVTAEDYYYIGWAFNDRKDGEKALAALDKAIELDPSYAEAYLEKVGSYTSLKRIDDALLASEKAVLLEKDYAEAFRVRAYVQARQEAYENAIADFKHCTELDPKDRWGYVGLAWLYARKRTVEAALQVYADGILADPAHAAFYRCRRGDLYLRQSDANRYVKAAEEFDQAIQVAPDYADGYAGRANTLYGRSFYTEYTKTGPLYDAAVSDYSKAIALRPKSGQLCVWRGIVRLRQGRLDSARADFDTAIRLNPKLHDAYFYRSKSYKSDKADQAFRALADRYAEQGRRLDAELKRIPAGDFDGRMAILNEMQRQDNAYQADCARIYQWPEFNQVLRDLNEAIRLNPDFGPAYYARWAFYSRRMQKDLADAEEKRMDELKKKGVSCYPTVP